jgi:RimJ/RimL family protein N-acetyltransferase
VSPDWPLETERLTLRPWTEGDFDAMFAMHSDPENARWLYNEPRDEDDTRAHLARKAAAFAKPGDWLSAAVVVRETGEVVGDVSMEWVSEADRTAEIGFIFRRSAQGKGYATEAARALLDWAFGAGFHRVVGRLEARNTASARVLEKLGMRLEAHLVENEWVKGEWQSELDYAILEREWQR